VRPVGEPALGSDAAYFLLLFFVAAMRTDSGSKQELWFIVVIVKSSALLSLKWKHEQSQLDLSDHISTHFVCRGKLGPRRGAAGRSSTFFPKRI
jgi:hypothetical protein